MLLAANHDSHRLGYFDANVFRDPWIDAVGGADAKGHAADRSHVRRVRIGANVQLPRQRVAFEHDRVADAFRSLAVGQFAVQANSLLRGEILLLEFELHRQIEQAELLLFFGNHFVEKCEVVAEEDDARGIVDFRILTHVAFEENRRHRRNVLVAEAEVGAREAGVPRLDRGHANFKSRLAALGGTGEGARPHTGRLHADLYAGSDHVARENLLGERHRPCGAGAPARVFDRRQKHFPLHARDVKREQSAILDHLPGNLILAGSELAQSNLFPAANAVDQREVGRSQQSQVLTILLVNAFNVFGDHHPNARAHLGIRRLLAARSLPAPLSTHGAHESAAFYVAAPDGGHAATLQSEVRNLAQGLVKIKTIVRGSYLIGRNVVTQLRIILGILRIPGQVFARELPLDQFRIFGKKKNASLEPDFVRPLFDLVFQE